MLGYDNIKLQFPYEIKTLLKMEITQEINNHGRIFFTGIVEEEKTDQYVNKASIKDKIKVTSPQGTLFNGILTNIKIKAVENIYYIEVEGITNTYDLDIKLKSKSFQDENMLYTDLIEAKASEHGGDYIDTITKGKKIEKLILQYNETNWEFLKRMASHFESVLVPDITAGAPKFWFGIPKGKNAGKIEDYHYTVKRDISGYMKAIENEGSGSENDFTYYEIESRQALKLGDKISIKGKSLIISKAKAIIEDSVLKYEYTLITKKGARKDTFYNLDIIGASIEGKVIDIDKDKIKIHLEIDKEQSKGKAKWFTYEIPYAVEGKCGWYMMPKLDDNVKLYFPKEIENSAVARISVRKDGDKNPKTQDHNTKYLETKDDKEMKLSPKDLSFTAKSKGGKISITMDVDRGIKIHSTEAVNIKSADDLIMNAGGKINISAKDNVYSVCKSTNFLMDGDTNFRARTVKVEGNKKVPV